MNDLISRQAAIECVYGSSPNRIKGRIVELPSAQPEITEKQVKEYCFRRNLVVVAREDFEMIKRNLWEASNGCSLLE